MRKILSVLLFIPLLIQAQQPVQPVLSADYLSLINSDSLPLNHDLPNKSSRPPLHINRPYPNLYPIKAIRVKNDNLTILPSKTKWLSVGGFYTLSAATSSATALPSLQNEYTQGESSHGALVWQGPETNELFSYGPSFRTLKYDGSRYPYDINGKLVPAFPGDSKRATPYDNNLFQPGYLLGQSLSIQTKIKGTNWYPFWAFSLKAANNSENTVLPENHNTSRSLSLTAERHLASLVISAGYSYYSSRFSNDNSHGFLNRVYQDALQTPPSFSNAQGATLAQGIQRAYSSQVDNPWFLLTNNGHFADRTQHTGSLTLQKKTQHITFGTVNSLDAVDDNGNQSLKPGTAFFPAGLLYTRRQNDQHYSSNSYLNYAFRYGGYAVSSTAGFNYIYNDEDVKIALPTDRFSYRRSTNEAAMTFKTIYEYDDITSGLNIGNKFYASSTSRQNEFFLPEISGFFESNRFNDYRFRARLTANYTTFCSEPPINQTLSSFLLTQLTPQEAYSFMPFAEVQTFNGLSPVRHQEFSSWILLEFSPRISFRADFTLRDNKDNVFPIYDNSQLTLKNIADTRYKGLELLLQFNNGYYPVSKFHVTNTISFYRFSEIATRVQDGYNYHPIAGFSTIYKALVMGRPVGVIAGNSYLRDAAGDVLIGQDGFPLVNNQPSVIGDPTPDYTIKFSHVATWRAFCVNIDWEYRKGGDIWNGTAAVLDYYGRSASTATQRNITGYVFKGQLQGGEKNNIPVAYYDPALPVGQNRWVRYGYTGVASSYIQKGDNIRVQTLSIAYDIRIRNYLKQIRLTAYAQNLLLWSAYKGVDPNQLLYDQPSSRGLDFFNLPSTKTYGVSASFQF